MYEIERKDDRIIVRRGSHVLFSATKSSWVVYREGPNQEVKISHAGDLTDQQLLLALANAIELKEFEK